MAKYKNIQSAIHNWTHSFLSIENYDEEGYFVKELYEAAKSDNAEKVTLDILSEKVSPDGVLTDRVGAFLGHCRESFISQLQSQNVEPQMLSSAILRVEYDFSVPLENTVGFSFRDPWKAPEAATYSTEIIAVDDRGIEHHAVLQEWWR
jgi:hypothetical protein